MLRRLLLAAMGAAFTYSVFAAMVIAMAGNIYVAVTMSLVAALLAFALAKGLKFL